MGPLDKLSDKQRYLASLGATGLVTFLAVGLVGGWVTLRTRNPDGSASLLSGAVIVLILLAGWHVGYKVRERHRLGLPLWRRLDEAQAHRLAQYRLWRRSGKIDEPPAAEVEQASRSLADQASAPLAGLSKRERLRRAQVRAQQERRRAREQRED